MVFCSLTPFETETTERYNLGTIHVPRRDAGRMEIDVQVEYTKLLRNNNLPVRESAIFKSKRLPEYFNGRSIYGGYVKYSFKEGSEKRAFLGTMDEEISLDKVPDLSILNTKRWDRDLVTLLNQLPNHVKDLFNF
jgi:hypothetical protein